MVEVLDRFENGPLSPRRARSGRGSPRLGALELVYVVRDDVFRPVSGVLLEFAPHWHLSFPASIWRARCSLRVDLVLVLAPRRPTSTPLRHRRARAQVAFKS